MARDRNQRVRDAAEAVLVEGERITSQGLCWGAQLRPRVPLLLLGRRQYLMALTDRRVLVFERRRRGPRASELVIGKRYEAFALEQVRRRRPLMQVQLRAKNGNVMVFEFRPRQRELGGELIARLTPSTSTPSHLMASLGAPADAPALTDAPADGGDEPDAAPAGTGTIESGPMKAGPMKGGSAATVTLPATPPVEPADPASDDDDSSFWDRK